MQGSKMTEEPEDAKVEKEDRRKAGAKGPVVKGRSWQRAIMKGAIQGKKGLWEDSGESGHKMFVLRGDTNIGQDQGEGGTTAQGVQGPVMMVSLCMVQKPHKWCAGDRRGQKWSPRSRRVSQDKATSKTG